MAGEFDLQSDGNWWNPLMNFLRSSPPYSSTIKSAETFNWQNHHHGNFNATSTPSISDGGSSSSKGDIGSVIHQNNHENPKNLYEIDNLSSINSCSDPLMIEINDDWNREFLAELETCTDLERSGTFTTINSASEHTEIQPLKFRSDDEHEELPNKLLRPRNGIQFDDDSTIPFWNSMVAASIAQSGILPSDLLNCRNPNFYHGAKHDEFLINLTLDVKERNDPVMKRPRIEAPSPLPTFKVRKEKLGDRITALQQLVSPFGKTDTASVLHEAIEYIKNLHEQVNVLTALQFDDGGSSSLSPLLPSHPGVDHEQQQKRKKKKKENRQTHDLKTRGLCVIPISSAFQVYGEGCNRDFLTPIFGGSFW